MGEILKVSVDSTSVFVLHRGSWGHSIHEPSGELIKMLPSTVTSIDAFLLMGKMAISVRSAIIPRDGEEPRWDDRKWQRARLRDDCRLVSVDITAPKIRHFARYCSSDLETPNGRILRGGFLVSSLTGDRVFAVLEALPKLFILDPSGELRKEVSFLEPGEQWPSFTEEEEKAQYKSSVAPLELRSRMPWCRGILRFEDKIALVFRLWDAEKKEARFIADLFDLKARSSQTMLISAFSLVTSGPFSGS